MNKLYKHLQHKRKKRILKKVGGYKYDNYIAYQKLIIQIAKSCGHEVAIKVRSMPRRRTSTDRYGGFTYSSVVRASFIWSETSEGDNYWYQVDNEYTEWMLAKLQDDVYDSEPTQ